MTTYAMRRSTDTICLFITLTGTVKPIATDHAIILIIDFYHSRP